MLFGFAISGASPYQSYVGYPTHIGGAQAYFFNNTHIRRLSRGRSTTHRTSTRHGPVKPSYNVLGGLTVYRHPYKNTNSSMPQRNLDYAEMQNELNQAIIGGQNVSQVGFEMTLAYNIGNDQRMIACNMIAIGLRNIERYEVPGECRWLRPMASCSWTPRHNGYLPMYDVGWLADFADPDNFCEPYQVSWGAFMSGQIDPTSTRNRKTRPSLTMKSRMHWSNRTPRRVEPCTKTCSTGTGWMFQASR